MHNEIQLGNTLFYIAKVVQKQDFNELHEIAANTGFLYKPHCNVPSNIHQYAQEFQDSKILLID